MRTFKADFFATGFFSSSSYIMLFILLFVGTDSRAPCSTTRTCPCWLVLEKLVFRLLPCRLWEFFSAVLTVDGGRCAPTSRPFGARRILSSMPNMLAWIQTGAQEREKPLLRLSATHVITTCGIGTTQNRRPRVYRTCSAVMVLKNGDVANRLAIFRLAKDQNECMLHLARKKNSSMPLLSIPITRAVAFGSLRKLNESLMSPFRRHSPKSEYSKAGRPELPLRWALKK